MPMDARGLAALVVLLLSSALLPCPASGSVRRVLEGEKPSSGQVAPAPTVAAGGSPKGDSPKESGQSSAAGQKAESHRHQKSLPPAPSPPKDTKVPSSEKGKEGGEAQASTTPPPPPPAQDTNSQKASPPPGGLGPNGGGEAKSGTDQEDTGSQGKKEDMDKMKADMEKCDTSHKCSAKEFSACLQASDHASVGSLIIVHNEGKNDIIVNIKEPSNIDIDKTPLHLAKGAFRQINITNVSGNITLTDGNGDCFIHLGQSVESQSVSNWQQQIQMFAAYATRLNPIYGASFFIFTVVLVGIVCACCKFARRRGNDAVPYQQLEMGAQAPNSSVVDSTTSTTDGWEDGWDDDWDDEEAPARPSDKKPTSSVAANGLSLRTQTNSKDGWDVDWDD